MARTRRTASAGATETTEAVDAAQGSVATAEPENSENVSHVGGVKVEYVEEGATCEKVLVLQQFISRATMEAMLQSGEEVTEIKFRGAPGEDGEPGEVVELWSGPLRFKEALVERGYRCDASHALRITEGVGTPEEAACNYWMPLLTFGDRKTAVAAIDPVDYIVYQALPSGLSSLTGDPAAKGDRFRTALDTFVRAIGKAKSEIHVFLSEGGKLPPNDKPETYLVELSGSPLGSNRNRYNVPRNLFGLPATNGGRTVSITPAMSHSPIFDDEGTEVGCHDARSVYFYGGNAGDVEILEAFFKAATVAITTGGVISAQEAQDRYVRLASTRFTREKAELEADLTRANESVREYAEHLTKSVREQTDIRSKLKNAGRATSERVAELVDEFQGFTTLDKVKRIYWRGESLCIATDIIDVVDDRTGHTHELGEFLIILNTVTGVPLFLNTTRKVNGFDSRPQMAPHVWEDGSACLGNVQDLLPKLVGSGKFLHAVHACLAFLDSANTSDAAGAHVHRWPVKKVKAGISLREGSGEVLPGAR